MGQNIKRIQNCVKNEAKKTSAGEVTANLNISIQPNTNYLKGIGKKRKFDKWVPFEVEKQKIKHMNAFIDHIQ